MLPLWYFAYKFGNLRSCIAQKETVFQLDSTTKMLQTRSPVNTLLCIWVFASQTSGCWVSESCNHKYTMGVAHDWSSRVLALVKLPCGSALCLVDQNCLHPAWAIVILALSPWRFAQGATPHRGWLPDPQSLPSVGPAHWAQSLQWVKSSG